MRPTAVRIVRASVVVATVAALGTAFGATNTVPSTRLTQTVQATTANTLKPSTCSAITLTAKVTGSGTIAGTAAAELLVGGAAVDTMTGANGNDCLIGGAGNDSLNGGGGTDVCNGGLGTDSFNASCETQNQ